MNPNTDQPNDTQSQTPQPTQPEQWQNEAPQSAPAPEPPVNDQPAEPASTPTPSENPLPPAPQPATVEPVLAPVAPSQTQPASSKGMAIAALVIGIIAFCTGFIGIGILLGVVAIILGAISLVKHQPGKAMAISGIVLGVIAILVGGLLFLITMVAYNGIQERAEQTQMRTDEAIQQKQEQLDKANVESELFE